ncbi:BCCT family transporter [Flammeovirga aprica]|uniref:BCCT transporter n=1 Tax=Flammeovirga aprica JL-4 TaxID=694437 RepID=A0A7X9P229_9BACT|nr:BCCT family transporter [Flammeovirga aprica]NME67753.1 BCCT transporter [Flammeovirga aprica JL-4]
MKVTFNHLSLTLSIAVALLFFIFPAQSIEFVNNVVGLLLSTFDSFFLLVITSILLLCLLLIISPYGNIKLGNSSPEFSNLSWFSMLFAAGMGSGLIFWGVAEPVFHLKSPLNPNRDIITALSLTNFHWGLHAWGIYAFSGLIIAWFTYNKGRKMTISYTLTPKVGVLMRSVDVLAVFSILFGVSGTLANSIALIQTGLNSIFESIEFGLKFRIVLLLFIAIIFTLSSLSGLKKGVQLLSNFNVLLASVLLLIVILTVGVIPLLNLFLEEFIDYIFILPEVSFSINPENTEWSRSWTIIYLLWWVAWAPFTGLFIARISKGRTIREFLLGVIGVPTLLSMIWFVAFGGGSSIVNNYAQIQAVVMEDYTQGIFTFFTSFQYPILLSLLAIILLITFVITSADSAVYVTALLTEEESKANKMIWSLVMVGITLALIYENNVDLNKVVAIAGAIPFIFLLILQGISFVYSLIKANEDIRKK